MDITVKQMETEDEIKGKAYVHWRAWHEAYSDIVSREYLDRLTREKCEEIAFKWTDNILVAKDADRVIGFVGYGCRENEDPKTGEIFALYVLSDFYGKGVAQKLMKEALEKLKSYPHICLRVLKENKRAIRFYQKCGFVTDGKELNLPNLGAYEIRMVLV